MREILLKKSLDNGKLYFYKSTFQKVLNGIIVSLLSVVFIPFTSIAIYFCFKNQSVGLLLVGILGIAFCVWFILGWITKGTLKPLNKVTKDEIKYWADNEINSGNVKNVINRIDYGYLGLRYSGLSIGAYYKDIYFVFDKENIFVTSVAIGNANDSSPVHYFSNKSNTNKLVKKLNSIQQAV